MNTFITCQARRNGTISDADAAAQRREVGEGITEQDEIIGTTMAGSRS
jgi:hypothetical protein